MGSKEGFSSSSKLFWTVAINMTTTSHTTWPSAATPSTSPVKWPWPITLFQTLWLSCHNFHNACQTTSSGNLSIAYSGSSNTKYSFSSVISHSFLLILQEMCISLVQDQTVLKCVFSLIMLSLYNCHVLLYHPSMYINRGFQHELPRFWTLQWPWHFFFFLYK